MSVPRFSRFDLLCLFAPPVLVLGLCSIYFISPEFYLSYVLERTMRERQLVELITFATSFAGSILCGLSALKFWKYRETHDSFGAFLIAGAVAGAAFFLAAEEVSWGQTWFGWKTPEGVESVETNLHNHHGVISVQMLGSAFLVFVFFVMPFVWRTRIPVKPPSDWKLAMAEVPVITCLAFGFLLSEVKELYRWLVPAFREETFYVEFIEQTNEYKEMLVGVTFLMYGIYRVRRARGMVHE